MCEVYAGVAEVSVGVTQRARGRGVGTVLMRELTACSEAAGIWTLQSVIFPGNAASIALHERWGFRLVGRRERIGLMPGGPLTGKWRARGETPLIAKGPTRGGPSEQVVGNVKNYRLTRLYWFR